MDNSKELTEEEEKQQSATITVLASPEQAKIITALENDGVAHVALISRNNDQLAEELLAEQDLALRKSISLKPWNLRKPLWSPLRKNPLKSLTKPLKPRTYPLLKQKQPHHNIGKEDFIWRKSLPSGAALEVESPCSAVSLQKP